MASVLMTSGVAAPLALGVVALLFASVSQASGPSPAPATADTPQSLLDGYGLVVAPGNQTAPALDWPYLAWEDCASGIPRVAWTDLSLRKTSPRFADGLQGTAGCHPAAYEGSRYPSIRGSLLAYAAVYEFDGPCGFGECIHFVNVSSHASWAVPGGGLYPVAVAGPHFGEIVGHEPLPPLILPDFEIALVSNGSTVSHAVSVDRYVPIDELHDFSFLGPVASGDLMVLNVRPFSTDGLEDCDIFGKRYGCINELATVHVLDGTVSPLTHSKDVVLSVPNGLAWTWSCYLDFTWEGYPSVADSKVYWQDNRNSKFVVNRNDCTWLGSQWDIYAHDLATGTEVPVLVNSWNETHPSSDGNILVWADDRNGNWDIYGMSLDTGKEFRITQDPAAQRNPGVSDGCVVWEDDRNGDWDIYGWCPTMLVPAPIDVPIRGDARLPGYRPPPVSASAVAASAPAETEERPTGPAVAPAPDRIPVSVPVRASARAWSCSRPGLPA